MSSDESILSYVATHTERGECQCGRCVDAKAGPEMKPGDHTVDMVFFKVVAKDAPRLEDFTRLTKNHRGDWAECDPLDGREHSYIELGAWIGDQGAALQYMALGVLVGAFQLLSPVLLGVPADLAMQMAQAGLLSVIESPRADAGHAGDGGGE